MGKTRIRIGMAATVAVAVAFGAAGCGGGDDSSSGDSTAAALTKDEFVTQGNQICADGNKQIETASKDVFSGGKPSTDEVKQFVTGTVIPSIQDQVDGIRALGAPAGDEDQVNAILDAAQQGIDDAKADPSLLESNGSNDPFEEANKLATAYGLTECAG